MLHIGGQLPKITYYALFDTEAHCASDYKGEAKTDLLVKEVN